MDMPAELPERRGTRESDLLQRPLFSASALVRVLQKQFSTFSAKLLLVLVHLRPPSEPHHFAVKLDLFNACNDPKRCQGLPNG